MPNLGETRYYKHRVGGQIEYSAQPWAGNIPEGYTPVAREQFLTETKARKFTHPGTKYPTYYEYLKGEQKGFEEMLAPGYIAPGFERFKPGAPTPSEEYFIPAEKKKAAQEWKEFQAAQAAITKPKTLGVITAPAAKAELPFPQSQAQMAEYQKKATAGEYIAPTKTGEKWYKSPTPIVPTPSVDPNEQARIDAANKANQAAQTIFDEIPKGDDVDMRDSSKILEDIRTKLEETEEKIPKPISLVDLFKEQKEKLGIEPLETELAGIDADIDRIQGELLVQAEEAGERLVSTREIGREKGQLQKRADREIALLNIERSAVARILGNKIDTLNAIVKLTDMDYDNASDYYTKEYNRNVQLYNLVSGAEERELTHAERATDDARATWTTITNLFKDNNLSYDALDTDQKLKIAQLEAQIGLPSGFTAQIRADEPDKKIQTVTSREDESGNTYYDVLLVDEDGAMTVKSIFKGKAAPTGKEGEIASVEKTLLESKAGGEFVDGNVYLQERSRSTLGPDEFNKRFGHLLSPADKAKYGVKGVPEEGLDPVLLKDLQDAVWAVKEQGGDEEEIKRRFLEKHPKEESLFNDYVGL